MESAWVPYAGLAADYLAVDGPIGVGKTSLATRLAEAFGGDLVLESDEKNPFLADFYRSGGRSALPAQLFSKLQSTTVTRSFLLWIAPPPDDLLLSATAAAMAWLRSVLCGLPFIICAT